MKKKKRIWLACALPWCLLVSSFALEAWGEEVELLVVGPRQEVRLQAAEPGARLEVALDGGPLHEREAPFLAPASGDHWLTLQARDEVGNLSPLRWVRLRVDSEGPSLDLVFDPEPVAGRPGGRRWLPPGSSLSLSAVDGLAGVRSVSLRAGEVMQQAAGEALRLTLPRDGSFELVATAEDEVGNRSRREVLDLAVDANPPTLDVSWNGPRVESERGLVISPSSRLNLKLHDAESGLGRWIPRIDGEDSSPTDLGKDWSEGPHEFSVEAWDLVGNALLGSVRFVVDGSGPALSWRVSSTGVKAADGRVFHSSAPTLEAAATDSPAGLESLRRAAEDGSFRPIEGPFTVTGDRVLIRATDRLGNSSTVEANWLMDLDAPAVRVLGPDGISVAPGETLRLLRGEGIELRVDDSGVGLAKATYRLNRSRALPLPDRLEPGFIGRALLTVEAVDLLGNAGSDAWYLEVRQSGRER